MVSDASAAAVALGPGACQRRLPSGRPTRGGDGNGGRDCPEFWGGLSLRVTAGPEPLQAGSREPGAGVRHHLRATHGDRRCGTGVSGSGPRTLPCQQGCPATRKWPWSTPQPWWSWGNRVHGTGAPTARPGVPAPGRHAHPCGEHEAAVRWGTAAAAWGRLAPGRPRPRSWDSFTGANSSGPVSRTAQGGRSQACRRTGAGWAEGRGDVPVVTGTVLSVETTPARWCWQERS